VSESEWLSVVQVELLCQQVAAEMEWAHTDFCAKDIFTLKDMALANTRKALTWFPVVGGIRKETFRADVKPLEGHDGSAYYTVALEEGVGWACTWWHGNQGHAVPHGANKWPKFSTKTDAQQKCEEHFSNLVKALSALRGGGKL
jgi:hypothetical protein